METEEWAFHPYKSIYDMLYFSVYSFGSTVDAALTELQTNLHNTDNKVAQERIDKTRELLDEILSEEMPDMESDFSQRFILMKLKLKIQELKLA